MPSYPSTNLLNQLVLARTMAIMQEMLEELVPELQKIEADLGTARIFPSISHGKCTAFFPVHILLDIDGASLNL